MAGAIKLPAGISGITDQYGNPILIEHGNANVSLSAVGGGLYLGLNSTSKIWLQGYSHCIDNGGAYYSGNAAGAGKLNFTGFGTSCFTVHQTDAFAGRSGWATYLICNHGDGAAYFHQILAMPFWGAPEYQRMENGTSRPWQKFYTTENLTKGVSIPSGGSDGDIYIKYI